jgi:hypothetical protein
MSRPVLSSTSSRSRSSIANRDELQKLVRKRQLAGLSSLQIAAQMQTAYPYCRLVERGLAGVTDEFLQRYRDAIAALSDAARGEVRE